MCFVDWDKVIDVLYRVVIPACVAYIAWLAYQVNQNKLKLDLYSRRFNVYESALNYYFARIYGTEQEFKEAGQTYTKHVREAGFLFGKDSDAFKTLMEFMQQMAIFLNPAATNSNNYKNIDPEKLLLKLEDALEPWLDFRNIAKSKPVED